jgi:hypothetical protein
LFEQVQQNMKTANSHGCSPGQNKRARSGSDFAPRDSSGDQA